MFEIIALNDSKIQRQEQVMGQPILHRGGSWAFQGNEELVINPPS